MLAADCSYAFNDYLQQGVEYGFLFLALLIFILSNLFSLKDPGNFFLSVSKITIIGILICMLFSYPLQNPSIVIAFFMLLSVSSAFDRRVITRFYPGKVFIAASFLTCIIMLVFVALYSVTSIAYGLKWKEADKQSEAKINGYVDNYDRIYDFLKRDRSFILNYGSILNISGNDQRCVAHYEKLGYMCPSAVMYMLLAESYFKLKDFEKAEENYKNASCMVPYLFYPKYKLFRLYQYQGKDKEALKIARQISKMDIKVYSNIVGDIKAEINKYLLNKTITNETAN